ncbi:MAG: hypothetical protein JZU65_17450 [Chlorobium sp.]|nr:hypothetical protein [Chlorobium sp.]
MLSFVKAGQFKANNWDDQEYVRKQFERTVTEMKKIKFIGPDGWNLTKADRWAKVNGDKRLEYRLGCAERAEQQMLKHGLIQPLAEPLPFTVIEDDYWKFSDLVVASDAAQKETIFTQPLPKSNVAALSINDRAQRAADYKQAITADWETTLGGLVKQGLMDEHGWIVSDELQRHELAKDNPEVAKALETYAVAEKIMQTHKMFDKYNPINPAFSTMQREEVKQSAEVDRLINSLQAEAPFAAMLLKFFVEYMRGFNEETAKRKAADELNERIERMNAFASSTINLASGIADKPVTEALRLGSDSVLENQQLQLEYKTSDAQAVIAQGLERIAEILRNDPTENMDAKMTQVYGVQCSMLSSLASISGESEEYSITGTELSGEFGDAMAEFNSVEAKSLDDRLAAMKITFSATKAPEEKIDQLHRLTESLKRKQSMVTVAAVVSETVEPEKISTGLATAEDVDSALADIMLRKSAGVGTAEISKSLSK